MRLRTKLFLAIGLLFLLMAIALFLIPSFLLDKDFPTATPQLKLKFALQILAVCALSLILTLFLLAYLSRSITKPISQLSRVVQKVGEGKLDNVSLPDVEGRKDEIALLVNSFKDMISTVEDREHIRAVLNKVVSKDVADVILKSTLLLGGEERIVTILFSDIRGFTKLTQRLSPKETIGMLNDFMTKMSDVIEGEGGVIDKYVGDEIMALYGAPAPHPDHAIRAISTALLMIKKLRKWNEERIQESNQPIYIGTGIHTGNVVAGNMGAENRLNYTVIGANVNLAARLCSIAEPMQILISDATLNAPKVRESFYFHPLPAITLKGFTDPVKVYEVTGFKWLI